MNNSRKRSLGALCFYGFETLDLFGPLEMFGTVPDGIDIHILAEEPGYVKSRHGQRLAVDRCLEDGTEYDLLLVPGGPGTRTEVGNARLLDWLKAAAPKAELVMSVCTGSALLARAGLLDGRQATTNKLSFDWVAGFGAAVQWQRSARWSEAGLYMTSSGVSAGMDMSLAAIARLYGEECADQVALITEYERKTDPGNDPFAITAAA